MGECHILAVSELRRRILTERCLFEPIAIVSESLFEPPHLWLLKVRSPLISEGYHGVMTLIVDDQDLRFKPDADV
jgi:hypothetical protein